MVDNKDYGDRVLRMYSSATVALQVTGPLSSENISRMSNTVLTPGKSETLDQDEAPEATAPMKPTLEFVLRPYRIPIDTVRLHHGSVLGMITKLLGVTPRHVQYLYLWQPGFETMCVLVPNLLDIPFSDFGIGSISPGLRSLTSYVAARTYGCGYCSAHCAAMGTIWFGDSVYLEKNAAALDPSKSRVPFSTKELAAMNLAQKLGRIPCEVTSSDRQKVASALSPRETEAVVNAISIMGYLTRFMNTMGMTLELERIAMGRQYLEASGWRVDGVYDELADAELMRDDVVEAAKQAESKKSKGLFNYIIMVLGAKAADMKAMAKIPGSDDGIARRCKEMAGFVPYYLMKMIHSNAKSAFAWAFLLRFFQGTDEVPAVRKQMMCYLLATNSGNTILRAHFAFIAVRSGVFVTRLADLTDSESDDIGTTAKEVAAIALAQATSFTPSHMTPTLVGLLSRQYSPAGIVELVTTTAVFHMFNLWTTMYPPTKYESEVAEFLQEHGKTLRIDPEKPCSDAQMEWESESRKAK